MADFDYRSFVIEHLINEELASNNYMVEWIQCIKEVRKIRLNHKSNNIRKFIITKRKNRLKQNSNRNQNKDEIEKENLIDTDIDSE